MAQANIRHPVGQDLDGIVEIYVKCFPDRVMEVFGGERRRLFIGDYLRFYLTWDPVNTWVYASAEEVLGVAIAPRRYSPLRAALSKGQCLTWLWHLLTGRYGFPSHIIKLFFTSGFAFSTDEVIRELWGQPYIHLLAVSPRYQGQGVGAKLLGCALDLYHKQNVKGCWLVVQRGNARGIELYRKFGFRTYKPLANGDLVMIWGEPHAAVRHR
jgi:ribosomal protein S18 acetylase RimI-like enzyme